MSQTCCFCNQMSFEFLHDGTPVCASHTSEVVLSGSIESQVEELAAFVSQHPDGALIVFTEIRPIAQILNGEEPWFGLHHEVGRIRDEHNGDIIAVLMGAYCARCGYDVPEGTDLCIECQYI